MDRRFNQFADFVDFGNPTVEMKYSVRGGPCYNLFIQTTVKVNNRRAMKMKKIWFKWLNNFMKMVF